MRILFIMPYVPSPIRVRSFNQIKQLAARHEVIVATLMESDRERQQAKELEEHCAGVHGVFVPRWRSALNCLRALPSSEPMQAAYCHSKEMERVVSRLVNGSGPAPSLPGQDRPASRSILDSRLSTLERGFDVVHVEHMRAARYAWGLSGVPCVFDSVDSISLLLERTLRENGRFLPRLVGLLELGKTRRFEQEALRHFPKVLATSPVDRQALLALHPEADVEVLTIGVDLGYFRPPTAMPRESKRLVFSGKMSYHANVEAVLYLCRRILPIVWSREPEVRLDIVGSNPPPEVTALARDGRITVTGYVDDIRPFLAGAAMAVCPMVYGAGLQIKVLEAMAMGAPVVATPQAFSALGVEAGKNIMSASNPEGFAKTILLLLEDGALRARLSSEGRAYVEEHHDWDKVGQKLETVYEEVIERWRTQKVGGTYGRAASRPVLMGRRS